MAQTQASGWADTIDKAARTPQSHVVMAVAVLTVLRIAIYAYTKNVPKHQRFGGYKVLQFLQEGFDAIVLMRESSFFSSFGPISSAGVPHSQRLNG